MERMLQGVQVWAPYESITLRSLASPDVLRSHWWGGYRPAASDATSLWSWLLEGRANFQEYFAAGGTEGLFNQNLTYRDYFLNLLPDLREIESGLGLLLAGSRVVSDTDVAVHYSRESFHASLALGELARTASSDKALADVFGKLAQDFRYAGSRQINDGGLLAPRAKVLFLPASYCLSERTAKAVESFARDGGTVVADVMPGVLSEYGRRLPSGLLDDLFGATCSGVTSPRRVEDLAVSGALWEQRVDLGLGAGVIDAATRTTTGQALAVVDGVPVVIRHDHGRGRSVLMNFDMARAPKAAAADAVRACLAVAGVRPEYRLDGPEGSRVSVLRRGDVTLVGVMLPAENPQEAELAWDAPMHAYDVRKGEYCGRTRAVPLPPLPPTPYGRRAQVHLIAIQPEPVEGIRLRAPSSIARGAVLPLGLQLRPGKVCARDRLLRIDVIDPSGAAPRNLRGFLTLADATASRNIPFAFNDPPGEWTVRATDVASGVSGDVAVRLE